MIGLRGVQTLRPITRSFLYRSITTTSGNELSGAVKDSQDQKELRERALAEAIAREEEAVAKEKALREAKETTARSIKLLNATPSDVIRDRVMKLQKLLDAMDNSKVKRLDEQLEEFLFEHMKVPHSEIGNRPWLSGSRSSDALFELPDEGISTQKIKTTTNSRYVSEYPNLKPTPDYKPYSSQELFLRHMSHLRQSGMLGSDLQDVYIPKNDVKKPPTVEEVSISDLMAAGCHLGHAKAMWRPSTQPFIYGEYDGIHLIDLNETLSALKKASKVVEDVAAEGGIILYVSTLRNEREKDALATAAKRSNAYYVSHRWIPGTITNFTSIAKQIGGGYTKEVDFGDFTTLRKVDEDHSLIKPDLVIVLNPVENRICLEECMKARIPSIGLCDTNMEPSLLTYPIPSNDDSLRAITLATGILSRAAEKGFKRRLQAFNDYKKSF